jgi:hypothetical protein
MNCWRMSRNSIFSSTKCRKWTMCNTFKLVHKLIFSLLDMLINVNWGGTRVILFEQSEFSMPGILCLANPTKRFTHFSCFLMFICYVVMTIKWLKYHHTAVLWWIIILITKYFNTYILSWKRHLKIASAQITRSSSNI